jgi:hypothetical protein
LAAAAPFGSAKSLYLTCRPHLEAVHARQPDSTVPVWDFEYRGWPWSAAWRAFPASQTAVLQAFLGQAPACYLQMNPSDVLDYPPSKSWARPYNETFELPPGVDAVALTREVLYLGGYLLYCAPAPVDPSRLRLNPWRTQPGDLMKSLSSLGITGLIASHHDNDAWRVSFPDLFAQRAQTSR